MANAIYFQTSLAYCRSPRKCEQPSTPSEGPSTTRIRKFPTFLACTLSRVRAIDRHVDANSMRAALPLVVVEVNIKILQQTSSGQKTENNSRSFLTECEKPPRNRAAAVVGCCEHRAPGSSGRQRAFQNDSLSRVTIDFAASARR